jgi:hypothetical protein
LAPTGGRGFEVFPLCDICRERNGGLVATLHRQVHVKVGDRESCVDEDLAGLIARVWTVGDTVSACQDGDDGRAYIVPEPESRERVAALLRSLDLDVEGDGGRLCFRVPEGAPPTPPARIDTAGPLPEVLARLYAEVAALRSRLAEVTTGLDHARIREARNQVDVATAFLESALCRSISPLWRSDRTLRPAGRAFRTVIRVVVLFAFVAAAALLSGDSLAWMAVAVVPGVMLGGRPSTWATHRLDDRLTRGRLATVRPAGQPADEAVSWPIRVRLTRIRADITALRSAAGTLLVALLDMRDRAVTGADVHAAAGRDHVFQSVLIAEEALAVAAYSLDVWRGVSPG